jgi:hypothetical protein
MHFSRMALNVTTAVAVAMGAAQSLCSSSSSGNCPSSRSEL